MWVSCAPFIHSFARGLSLPFGDCVNDAAVNIHIQAVVHKYTFSVAGDERTCFQFFGYIPRGRIAGLNSRSIFFLILGNCILFSIVVGLIQTPTSNI